VHDAGNRAAVLRLDDEHIAAVPLGDDLLLEILRGLLPAQIRLERAAQARPLFAETLAYQPQFGARAVEHVARRFDLLADLAGFALERRSVGGDALERRKRPRRAANPAAGVVHRIEKIGQRDKTQRFE